MDDAVLKARVYAIAAHGDQRYGAHPYRHHLDAVANILAPFGTTAQIVGYLHDTIEDTDVSHADIETRFGLLVADCVAILSDEAGPDRKTRKTLTYVKMAKVDGDRTLALIVKAADRLANVRACIDDGNHDMLEKYRGEHPNFRPAAFRPGLCDVLWGELDRLLAASH